MQMFNEMFNKINPGMCRLSVDGNVAVKTNNGYKSYDVKSGKLINCENFCFDIGQEFFFVVPTNKVDIGDIILVNGKPRCVKEANKDNIIVINYEDSTIDTILPERYIFMGNAYFYGKIVSMFGSNLMGDKKGTNNIMKYIMLSEMFKSNGGDNNNFMGNMLPLMMMGNMNFDNMFDGIFDDDEEQGEK